MWSVNLLPNKIRTLVTQATRGCGPQTYNRIKDVGYPGHLGAWSVGPTAKQSYPLKLSSVAYVPRPVRGCLDRTANPSGRLDRTACLGGRSSAVAANRFAFRAQLPRGRSLVAVTSTVDRGRFTLAKYMCMRGSALGPKLDPSLSRWFLLFASLD